MALRPEGTNLNCDNLLPSYLWWQGISYSAPSFIILIVLVPGASMGQGSTFHCPRSRVMLFVTEQVVPAPCVTENAIYPGIQINLERRHLTFLSNSSGHYVEPLTSPVLFQPHRNAWKNDEETVWDVKQGPQASIARIHGAGSPKHNASTSPISVISLKLHKSTSPQSR